MYLRASVASLVAAVALGAPPVASGAQPAAALYRCADATTVEVAFLGLGLCDATPTPLLAERAEPDNLQTRDGALVVEAEDDGIAAIAGTRTGDMIYRVGGVDVTGAEEAAAELSDVGTDSDTLMNFLRRGRPYLIKLRR